MAMKILEGRFLGRRNRKCKDPEVGTALSNSKGIPVGDDEVKAKPGSGCIGLYWS